jgi:hypothetical protein
MEGSDLARLKVQRDSHCSPLCFFTSRALSMTLAHGLEWRCEMAGMSESCSSHCSIIVCDSTPYETEKVTLKGSSQNGNCQEMQTQQTRFDPRSDVA